MAYNFENLSPFDFERLARDLLNADTKAGFESFKPGRDKGVDLRAHPEGKTWIAQCKHFVRSPYSALIRELKKEANKVALLRPDRYFIVTSLCLTAANKTEIVGIFAPYIKSEADVVDGEQLNRILSDHKDVETKHFKLWITSTSVMNHVLHAGIMNMSRLETERIFSKAERYVHTERFIEVAKVLEDRHFVMLTGIPGIGKTTLAEMLLLHLMKRGFEAIKVTGDISEALDVMKPSDYLQVFYYDDFLGATFQEHHLAKNEQARLLQFVEAIRKSKNTRLILTTREYVLAQAQGRSEQLARWRLNEKEVIELQNYSRFDKAWILYNHIHYSNLPIEYKAAILAEKGYVKIIAHRNYNPRIVEWLTDPVEVQKHQPAKYLDEFLANLTYPGRLWEHAFENQLSEQGRMIVLVLGTFGEVSLALLEQAWRAFGKQVSSGKSLSFFPTEFKKALREIHDSFVRTTSSSAGFHNPSIQDFIEKYLADNQGVTSELIASAIDWRQCERIWGQIRDKQDENPVPLGDLHDTFVLALERTLLGASMAADPLRVLSFAKQFGFLAEMHVKYPKSISALLESLLQVALEALKEGRLTLHAVTVIARSIAKTGFHTATVDEFIRIAGDQLSEYEHEDAADFSDHGWLSRNYPDLLGSESKTKIANAFSDWADDQQDYYLEDCKDPALIRGGIEELEDTAREFDLELDLSALEERAEKLENRIEPDDDNLEDLREDRVDTVDEIEYLFDRLLIDTPELEDA